MLPGRLILAVRTQLDTPRSYRSFLCGSMRWYHLGSRRTERRRITLPEWKGMCRQCRLMRLSIMHGCPLTVTTMQKGSCPYRWTRNFSRPPCKRTSGFVRLRTIWGDPTPPASYFDHCKFRQRGIQISFCICLHWKSSPPEPSCCDQGSTPGSKGCSRRSD